MPYMSGYTDEVEKALFLQRFGVPYWGITYLFGKNDMHWERHVVGASITARADTPSLTEAYSHFKHEAQRLKPDYQPETVNIDGWTATKNAWLKLFPMITLIQCFLHAYLSIQSRCKKLTDFPELCQQIWDIYHAPTPDDVYRQVAELYA
jgi:hypothetical protein